jgi:hypothetical protein
MKFEGQGRPLSDEGITRICDTLDCDQPTVWAVLSVETSGFGFLQDRRPQILFERHIFHRLTGGRFDAGQDVISHRTRGGYKFGVGEYPRLERAIGFDEEAALNSASWGAGQVMGFNHAVAGFTTVQAMVNAMVRGEDAQLIAMANFIKANNLARPLRNQDWTTFARGYNGPAFAENEYDEKLKDAHAKYRGALPNLALRTAQAGLLYLGLEPGPVDGVAGKRTRSALITFQAGAGLPQTGGLDSTTEGTLLAAAFPDQVAGHV